MPAEICDKLTLDTYIRYGNRKKPGRISFLVDVGTETIYPVPREIEHIDYAMEILGEAPLPDNCKRLVPSHIDTQLCDSIPRVVGVITGVSGLEISLGIKHTRDDLRRAHDTIWNLINQGEIGISKVNENKIVERYASD